MRRADRGYVEDGEVVLQLHWSVQALAAGAQDQIALFPKFVCVACELLWTFDTWHLVTGGRPALAFPARQRDALTALQALMRPMLASPCCSREELASREDWVGLRLAAAGVLAAFGWEPRLPPRQRSVYVRGR